MSAFDLFLLVPIAFGAFRGFRQGLVLEVISLISLFIGIILALKFLNQALPVMRGFFGDLYGILPFFTFLVVFGLVIMAVRLFGIFLKTAIHFTPLGVADNVLGGLLGALKWGLALSLLLYVANLAGLGVSESAAQASVVYPKVAQLTPVALKGVGAAVPFAQALLQELKTHF